MTLRTAPTCPDLKAVAFDCCRAGNTSWRSLFSFAHPSHSGVFLAATLASFATAAFRTALSIFIGHIFSIVAEFANGTRTGDSAIKGVERWCLALSGLGLGHWLASSALLSLWIVFGELQARNARRDVVSSLLGRDLACFDASDQGIPGLLLRIQT